jgi:hypothetical protein
MALVAVCALAAVPAAAAPAAAGGGSYVIVGGTPAEQAQVRSALDASAFDWSVVQQVVTIRIARGRSSCGTPGQILLDADLLDAGRISWGVVQHEYAHQVDFLVLQTAARARLQAALGGVSWWQTGSLPHGSLTSERFATTLAWAYWPARDNVMAPAAPDDEAGWIAPAAFRALVASLLRNR